MNLLCLHHTIPQRFIEHTMLYKGRVLSSEATLVRPQVLAWTERMQEAIQTPFHGRKNLAICSPWAPQHIFCPKRRAVAGHEVLAGNPTAASAESSTLWHREPHPLAWHWLVLSGLWKSRIQKRHWILHQILVSGSSCGLCHAETGCSKNTETCFS